LGAYVLAESEIKLLSYQITELIKKQDTICIDLKNLVEKMDKRISTVESRVAWIYGLLAGLGVVSITTLVKLFL